MTIEDCEKADVLDTTTISVKVTEIGRISSFLDRALHPRTVFETDATEADIWKLRAAEVQNSILCAIRILKNAVER